MSQTCFSPESPADRITRLLGQAFSAEVRRHPTMWPHESRKAAIDCIKWLGGGVPESINSRRDSNGVRFIKLNEEQSDMLHTLLYEIMIDEPSENPAVAEP